MTIQAPEAPSPAGITPDPAPVREFPWHPVCEETLAAFPAAGEYYATRDATAELEDPAQYTEGVRGVLAEFDKILDEYARDIWWSQRAGDDATVLQLAPLPVEDPADAAQRRAEDFLLAHGANAKTLRELTLRLTGPDDDEPAGDTTDDGDKAADPEPDGDGNPDAA